MTKVWWEGLPGLFTFWRACCAGKHRRITLDRPYLIGVPLFAMLIPWSTLVANCSFEKATLWIMD